MKSIDKNGLLLCDLQAQAFELSVKESCTSSDIFIRRFMNSELSKRFDDESILGTNTQPRDVINILIEQYGPSDYGSVKHTENEMYWMGHLYRYLSYCYSLTSVQAYKIIKPKELRALYLPYHTMDTAQAVERIMESKNLLLTEQEEIQRQFNIFKRIRKEA